jgi:hypothetical protein
VTTADGEPLRWEGFTTGPVVLDDDEITAVSRLLLGLDLAEVSLQAARRLLPHVDGTGPQPPALLMHSATQTTKGFEGDLSDVQLGRLPYDVPGYLEARVVSLGRPGDLAVGRTEPWLEAVRLFGADHLDLGDRAHYYLSHALLAAATVRAGAAGAAGAVASLGHVPAHAPSVLDELVAWVRAHPDVVVRLYALDQETQVFLLWLADAAGLERLAVDANAPVVAQRWNRKNGLHPTVAAAAALTPGADEPAPALLVREQEASDAFGLLGLRIPVLPGYRLERAGDAAGFADQAVRAARMLRERHGLTSGCLKPCEAGDGARIVAPVDLADEAVLAEHSRQAYRHGDDYLLEAFVRFPTFEAGGRTFIVAPSGHIRGGHVTPGFTVQLMHGCAWEGNAFFDAGDAATFSLSPTQYTTMVSAMDAVLAAFGTDAAEREGCRDGLVTGGVDFAVGHVGGLHPDPVVAVIDLNLSSHGAEYLRAFHDAVRVATAEGAPVPHVATRVYRPAADARLTDTDKVVGELTPAGSTSRVVASVAGRWGMVGITGDDPLEAVRRVLALVEALTARGLAKAP